VMPALFAEIPTFKEICFCMSFWGLLCGVIGLWLLLPARIWMGKQFGCVLVMIAGALLAYDLPRLGDWTEQSVFWLLGLVTMGSAVAMITTQSPVYAAIWFALSLLGTAGLFFQSGAQFLGVATVVVYAGAIVVTFLFVIMLAQPEGQSSYDRLSWGGLPKVLAVVTAGLLMGLLTFMLTGMKKEAVKPPSDEAITATTNHLTASDGILAAKHMANLGRRLFSEQLIAVELAGTLLLVALVGAVAIAMQRRPRLERAIEEVLR